MTTPPNERTIGRYKIVRPIGQGGMGSLFLAHDPVIDRLVAIKSMREGFDNDELRERFAREARAAGRLRHPNIVTIFDVGEHEGQPFIAMEYLPGETIGEMIRRRAEIRVAKKLALLEEICEGLEYAHKSGMVHRDIKPANVMYDPEAGLKILDFGIVRLAESGMTQAGMLVGTLNYMSPEQMSGGQVDRRSDIFAVGALAYELFAYTQAFAGTMKDGVMHRIMHEPPQPLEELCPGIDPEIPPIVERALEKDVARRYQNLTAMRKDLEKVRERLEEAEDATGIRPGPESDETVAVGSATPKPDSRPGTDRSGVAKRRAQLVERQIEIALAAYEAGDYKAALEAADQAVLIDPTNTRANRIFERAQAADDEQEVRRLLGEAREQMERGDSTRAGELVDQVLAKRPSLTEARSLKATIREVRRDKELARERAQLANQTLERARSQLQSGAYEAAIRTADEVLALQPHHVEARALREQASAAIAERERQEAQRRQEEARLRELERQQAEARERRRQQKIVTIVEAAAKALDEERLTDASDILGQAEDMGNPGPAVDELRQRIAAAQAEAERRARIRRRVEERLTTSRRHLERGELHEARAAVEAALLMAPDDGGALIVLDSVAQAEKARALEIQREAEARAREQAVQQAVAASRAASHEDAIGLLRTALEQAPADDRLQAELLARETQLARQRDEEARLAREAEEARKKQEEEARLARAAEQARLKREEGARLAREAEKARKKQEEEARLAREAEAARLKREEDARLAREAEEASRKQEEEALLAREAEQARLKREKDARLAREAEEARKKQEEEARLAREAEAARLKREEEAQLAREAEEASRKQEEEARLAREAEQARLKHEEEARLAREAEEARKKQEEEARLAREAEAARLKREEEARLAREAEEARGKQEEEARLAREAEAGRLKHEEEARRAREAEEAHLKQEEEARLAREAEAARLKREEDARLAREAEAVRLKREENARLAREAEAARLKREEDARLAREAEKARKKQEKEARQARERAEREEAARRALESAELARPAAVTIDEPSVPEPSTAGKAIPVAAPGPAIPKAYAAVAVMVVVAVLAGGYGLWHARQPQETAKSSPPTSGPVSAPPPVSNEPAPTKTVEPAPPARGTPPARDPLAEAQEQKQNGRVEEAIKTATAAYAQKPDPALAGFLDDVRAEAAKSAASERAQAEKTPDARRTKDYAQAIDKAQQASRLKNPADTGRAVALFTGATELFRSAIKNSSSDPNVFAAKAKERLDRGDRAGARDFAVQSLTLDRNNKTAADVLERVRKGAYDRAGAARATARAVPGTENLPQYQEAEGKRRQGDAPITAENAKDKITALEEAAALYSAAAETARKNAETDAAEARRKAAEPAAPTVEKSAPATPPATTTTTPTAPKSTEPPPLPSGNPPAASKGDLETPAIRAVYQEYKAAFERVDAVGVARVYPSVPRTVTEPFKNLNSQTMDFKCNPPTLGADGLSASMACTGTVTQKHKASVRAPAPPTVTRVFTFAKAGGGWVISDVR